MKRIVPIALAITLLLLLSSCGNNENNNNQSMATTTPTKKPFTISYIDFSYFDPDISWYTTYIEMVHKYGESDYPRKDAINYNNFNVCGYDQFYSTFQFAADTGRLSSITLQYKSKSESESKRIYADIVQALTYKYGEPEHNESEKGSYDYWSYQVEDTSIGAMLRHDNDKTYYIMIYYFNERD